MIKSRLHPLLLSVAFSFIVQPCLAQDAVESVPVNGDSTRQAGSGNNNVQSVLRTIAKLEDATNTTRFPNGEDNFNSRQSGAREELNAAVRDADRKLTAMGPSIIPQLLDNLNDRHQQVGNICARVLGRNGKAVVIPIIKRIEENMNPNINYYNHHREIQIMQQVGSDIFEPLNQALKSESPEDRMAAAQLLGELCQYSSPSNEEALVFPLSTIDTLCSTASTDSNARVRDLSANALGRIGPRNMKVTETLVTLLKSDSDPKVRRKAAQALGLIAMKQSEIPAQETAKALAVALASDEYEGVRMTAATSLGQAKSAVDIAAPALIKALKDPLLEVKNAALNSLCNFGSKAAVAVPDLVKSLNGTSVRESQTAVRLLAQIGPAAAPAVPTLLKLAIEIKPTEQYLRYNFLQAFAAIGPKALPAVPYLIEMLHSQDYNVQREAIHALGSIGPAAHPAETALRDLAERDPRLKVEAEQALLQIRKGGIPKNLIET